ncbi:MAG: YidC/Oxa1 family membrane protein insertase [Dehalococcoidia bacterium]|nr:YidC/Oxa1 family membrane protein insertase [Dehalococcoidia bacterium]
MVLLTVVSFGSYGLAILLFTFITRVITFPLTMRTMRSTRAMSELQPQLQEIQKKYSDPRRRSEETMKLYRESGVNPIGCLGSQLLQFPLFIAMYQVIRTTLGGTPEGVLYLESRIYDFDMLGGTQFLHDSVPLSTNFLFLDLSSTGYSPTSITFMLLVFASMWLQQRISTSRTKPASDQQQQMNQMMQWMMPVMFAWFVVVVPAGLGLYWTATTIIGIVLHWIFLGPGDFTWGSIVPQQLRARLVPAAATASASTNKSGALLDGADATTEQESSDGANSGDQRRRRRRSRRTGAQQPGSQSRSSRRRRRQRR